MTKRNVRNYVTWFVLLTQLEVILSMFATLITLVIIFFTIKYLYINYDK